MYRERGTSKQYYIVHTHDETSNTEVNSVESLPFLAIHKVYRQSTDRPNRPNYNNVIMHIVFVQDGRFLLASIRMRIHIYVWTLDNAIGTKRPDNRRVHIRKNKLEQTGVKSQQSIRCHLEEVIAGSASRPAIKSDAHAQAQASPFLIIPFVCFVLASVVSLSLFRTFLGTQLWKVDEEEEERKSCGLCADG